MPRAIKPTRRRVVLHLDTAVIRALKVRAAQEGVPMRHIVERWVQSWKEGKG